MQVPLDVATFLLNEKRAEIHQIESRLTVVITLIPNANMETPHYTVTRLRQDDMTAENLQASYKLVAIPEANHVTSKAAQETKPQRPQAVVQGVTPPQPAPMRAVGGASQPSIFTKLIGWLKSLGAEKTPEKVITQPRTNNPPRRERENRNSSGNRPDSNRPEGNRQRNPRRDREEAHPRVEKNVQTAPKTQEPRAARPPRPPRVPVETAVLESIAKVAPATDPTEENSQSTGRKRGRRGGQRERERRDQQAAGQLASEEPILTETTPNAVMNAVEITRHSETAEPKNIQNIEPPLLHVEQANTSTQASSTINGNGNGNGLVQIETDAVKRSSAAAVAAQVETAPPPASRRRSRPREIYSMENSEPLVQIETQQTLS